MDNAVVLLDRYGKVTDVNRQAAVMFGISPAMIGQHNIQVIGLGALEKAVRETVGEGQSRHIDLQTALSGVKKVFQVFLAPRSARTGSRRSPVRLPRYHSSERGRGAAGRIRRQRLPRAGHAVTTIKGFAETLLDGALSDPALSVKFITVIQEEADRMHRLVKDLMQLARLNSEEIRRQVKLEPTAVAEVAETVISQLYPQWHAKNLNVTLDAADEPVRALANTDWLTQVLVNLFDNSIKFTPTGGKITISCRREGGKALLQVTDTGSGIPAVDLPHIFDRFYRVDKARVREGGGTGLGLSIVKFIVETLDGSIDVKSKAGEGTAFTVILPLAD
jgi:two-component system phosphate regulon sensor histidine kinase PhoR